MNHLNHFHVLQNTCLVGLTIASTILSLSLNTPPVLAVSQEPITQPVSNANNQKERVQIKRVIYFHLLNEVKKVEQMSYAHREVTNNPTQKAIWIIEPFEEVDIPDQPGFKPSMDKIPTVTEIEDLPQLKSTVNVYYQPLNKDEVTKKDSKENTLAEKKAVEKATENKKEEKKDSQDNYPVEEDLGDDSQVTGNYGEVNNTRKQQNLHQRVTGINNRLNRSHRNSRKNDNSDQQILPQTGNETDNLTTFLGLGITIMVAGMSLFSLKKAHKKK
ncbi:LPXTG cell wall anchor domain-containing protein [Limosilactobacillus reuteri]|uniref:LPXTG cell wall anchor domain-containing protein n=1 Tax=Limosilactobacillus reuteri TaxID=1598 RepID=UPI00146E6757|nr:LPXTG cell wall anchor domain-containing protein [Limosilactobacillus reuteri]WPU43676.1 LPXTG cell wall anchor domain-containing protein [Limosilactobacillus reuteri]